MTVCCVIKSFFFFLFTPSEKPDTLNVSYATGRRNATLRWAYPYDGHRPVTLYTISYKSIEGTSTAVEELINDGHTLSNSTNIITYTLDNLMPFTNYTFSVTATNAQGNSTPSNWTMQETEQDSKSTTFEHFTFCRIS